tara:strand:+ start:2216 stop:2902 length:687 start_codon:yes stop_codon:yes gene_type:complete
MDIKKKFLEHASDAQLNAAKSIRDCYREKMNPFPYRRYIKKNKCIFIHIPKTAGTSILHALGHKGGRDHSTYREFMKANPTRFNDYFKFCFVRHPEDRFISLYKYFKNGGNNRGDILMSQKIKKEGMTVSDFALYLEDAQLYLCNPMFWPQFMYICDSHLNIMVDSVFRYEKIEEDFKVLSEKIGLSSSLQSKNRSQPSNENISEEAKRIVGKIYKQDYKIFNYTMNI